MTLQEIRKHDEDYSHWVSTLVNAPPSVMTNEEQAMLDRHELLEIIDEGREIVKRVTAGELTHGHGGENEFLDEMDEWLKKVTE